MVDDGDMFVDRARDRGPDWEGAVQDGRNDQTLNCTMIYLAQEPSPGVGFPQCQSS
jgi:hypothetical protein